MKARRNLAQDVGGHLSLPSLGHFGRYPRAEARKETFHPARDRFVTDAVTGMAKWTHYQFSGSVSRPIDVGTNVIDQAAYGVQVVNWEA